MVASKQAELQSFDRHIVVHLKSTVSTVLCLVSVRPLPSVQVYLDAVLPSQHSLPGRSLRGLSSAVR